MISPKPPARGTYVLLVHLPQETAIAVGRQGVLCFPSATYLYVGSASQGLPQRLARHVRLEKRRHWHIDYLTVVGEVRAAWIWPPGRECALAQQLAVYPQVSPWPSGFGCSDCRCPTHLFRCQGSPREALTWLRQHLRDFVTELSAQGIIRAASRRLEA